MIIILWYLLLESFLFTFHNQNEVLSEIKIILLLWASTSMISHSILIDASLG